MKRRVKKRTNIYSLAGFFSILILLLNYNFLNLVRLPGTYGARTNVILQSIASIIGLVLCYFKYKKRKYTFGRNLIYIYIFLLIEIVYTVFAYPMESPSEIMKMATTYLLLLSYFVISKYCRTHYEKYLGIVIYVSTAVMLIFVVQALLFNFRGIKLFQIYQFSYGRERLDIRNLGIRLIAPDLVETSAILSIGLLFRTDKGNHKKGLLLSIIICVVYELYAARTRSTLIVILVTFFICTLIAYKKNPYMKLMLFFLGIVIIILVSDEIFGYFSNVFFVSRRSDYSFYHREDAYIFYLNRFLEHPLFGIGLLPDNTVNYYHILHGYKGFSISDVGLIGVMARFGIAGLLGYGYLLIYSFKRIKIHDHINPVILSVYVAILLSTINLSVFDAERLFSLVILLIVLENETLRSVKFSS